MIKALRETKPKPETKPQTTKPEPKPQTPKPESKPQTTKPKPEIRVNKRKLKKLRKDFDKLRPKFSKKEIDRYRKAFYVAKNKKYLSESEIKKTNKNLTRLKKSLRFKKSRDNIDSVDYEELNNYDYNYDFADDDEYRKIGSIRTLFKEFDKDYYKPVRADGGFAERNNNYIEYMSKGDRYENLSSKEYLNVIRPYLRDLINEHKPTAELNNNNNNNCNNDDNNNNNNNSNNNNREEWKIQLTMQNSCISTKSFEETGTIYTKSELVKVFMGKDTKDVLDKLFNTLLERFQNAQETSNKRGSEFIPDSAELLYNHFQRIDIRRAESDIIPPDWIASKKATINPKIELVNINGIFKWSIISGLNYNKINEKYLRK